VFVGTISRLIPLVQLVCMDLSASFRARGLTLPPWRQVQSMMSKWLPARSQEVAMGASQRAASPLDGPQGGGAGSAVGSHGLQVGQRTPGRAQQQAQRVEEPQASGAIAIAAPRSSGGGGGGSSGGSSRGVSRSLLSLRIAQGSTLPAAAAGSSAEAAAAASSGLVRPSGIISIAPQYSGEPRAFKVKVGFKP
jgi:hypothetical protein